MFAISECYLRSRTETDGSSWMDCGRRFVHAAPDTALLVRFASREGLLANTRLFCIYSGARLVVAAGFDSPCRVSSRTLALELAGSLAVYRRAGTDRFGNVDILESETGSWRCQTCRGGRTFKRRSNRAGRHLCANPASEVCGILACAYRCVSDRRHACDVDRSRDLDHPDDSSGRYGRKGAADSLRRLLSRILPASATLYTMAKNLNRAMWLERASGKAQLIAETEAVRSCSTSSCNFAQRFFFPFTSLRALGSL